VIYNSEVRSYVPGIRNVEVCEEQGPGAG